MGLGFDVCYILLYSSGVLLFRLRVLGCGARYCFDLFTDLGGLGLLLGLVCGVDCVWFGF